MAAGAERFNASSRFGFWKPARAAPCSPSALLQRRRRVARAGLDGRGRGRPPRRTEAPPAWEVRVPDGPSGASTSKGWRRALRLALRLKGAVAVDVAQRVRRARAPCRVSRALHCCTVAAGECRAAAGGGHIVAWCSGWQAAAHAASGGTAVFQCDQRFWTGSKSRRSRKRGEAETRDSVGT